MTSREIGHDDRAVNHERIRTRQRSVRTFVAVSLLGMAVVIAATSPAADAHSRTRPPRTIDWADPSVVVEHPGGWTTAVCGPWVPTICVERNGQRVGIIDVVSFPTNSFEDPELATTNPRRFLRGLAAALVPSQLEGRQIECGTEYTLEPVRARNRRVLGHNGIVFGFRGNFAGRPVTDEAIVYAAVVGDEVMMVAASARDPEGCGDGESSFLMADLDAFRGHLRSIARTLPPPTFISENRP